MHHITYTRQQGIALLIFVIIIALTSVSYFMSDLTIIDLRIKQDEKTQRVLAEAKRSIIAFALSDSDTSTTPGKIGKLPCPDINGALAEGFEDSTCGTAYGNGIGYFPWKSVGLDVLQDESGTCLLFAVSPAYKNNPNAALNPDSYGQFQIVDNTGAVIQGLAPEDRPVAVIIAAGAALPGQVRNYDNSTVCDEDYNNISAYLDNDGVTNNSSVPAGNDIIDQLVQKFTGSVDGLNPLNDRFVTITHDEIWGPLQAKMVRGNFDSDKMRNLIEALSVCMAGYGTNNGGNLPMPVPLNVNGGEYRKDVDYDDNGIFTSAYAGRYPYDVERANDELVNGHEDHLFDNDYCNDLTLPLAGLMDIDLHGDTGSDNGEYRRLWQNWKDHFFYAVSKSFNPSVGAPTCGNCMEVNGSEYAGIVFYAGMKRPGQQRYSPPFDSALALDAVDDKDDVSNYLENGNDVNFPDDSGDSEYFVVDGANSNDIMFCIKDDMSIVECL